MEEKTEDCIRANLKKHEQYLSEKDRIIAILKKHEEHLSDGFRNYMPLWLPEYGDLEKPDAFLNVVATEILAALEEVS